MKANVDVFKKIEGHHRDFEIISLTFSHDEHLQLENIVGDTRISIYDPTDADLSQLATACLNELGRRGIAYPVKEV